MHVFLCMCVWPFTKLEATVTSVSPRYTQVLKYSASHKHLLSSITPYPGDRNMHAVRYCHELNPGLHDVIGMWCAHLKPNTLLGRWIKCWWCISCFNKKMPYIHQKLNNWASEEKELLKDTHSSWLFKKLQCPIPFSNFITKLFVSL